MAITSNQSNFFGKVTIIEGKSGAVTVSTAKEGIFKGLSTVVSVGRYPNVTPFAKLFYVSQCSSEDRRDHHDMLAKYIDVGIGEFNREPKDAIMPAIDMIRSSPYPLIKEVHFQK